MSRLPLLDANTTYTFRSYFDLGISAQDLAIEFDYHFQRSVLELPQYAGEIERFSALDQQIRDMLPRVDLANEATRREILIAPVITEVVRQTNSELKIEYAIKVERRLQGNLDYYLRAIDQLLIVEAKHEDLFKGFSQLTAELIAFDQWTDSPTHQLLGAVTTGRIWEFACLDRRDRQITQGLNQYRVPEDLESLLRILLQALILQS